MKVMVQQCFFVAEKQQKAILNFSLDSLIATELCNSYWMKQTILNLWQENGTLSIIIQRQIMM